VIDSKAFLGCLRTLTGMDEWTAQYIAMRALGEPDAFPADKRNLPANFDSVSALKQYAEAWRPWRAYAAIYLGMQGSGQRGETRGVSVGAGLSHAPSPAKAIRGPCLLNVSPASIRDIRR
jgi:hypothetical protein